MSKLIDSMRLLCGRPGFYLLAIAIAGLAGWLIFAALALWPNHPSGLMALMFLLTFLSFGLAFLALVLSTHAHRILWFFAALVLGIVLCYGLESLRGYLAWHSYKHSGEARGDRFELAHYVPADVEAEENFFETPLWEDMRFYAAPFFLTPPNVSAITWANPAWAGRSFFPLQGVRLEAHALDTWRSGIELSMEDWRQRLCGTNSGAAPVITLAAGISEGKPQDALADVLAVLSKSGQDRQTLIDSVGRPKAKFWINYDAGYAAILPHLHRVAKANRYLALHAEASRQSGNKAAAMDDIRASFRLIEALRPEPIDVSQMVRIRALANSLQPIWQGMARHDWNEAELKLFELELRKFDFLADYDFTMRGERAFALWALDFLQTATPEQTAKLIESMGRGGSGPPPFEEFFRYFGIPNPFKTSSFGLADRITPSGWYNCDRRLLCQVYDAFLSVRTNGTLSPAIAKRAQEDSDHRWRGFYSGLPRKEVLSAVNAAAKFAHAQTMADLAKVACALERHRLAHRKYPESLDGLRPGFMDRVPVDVVNGKPLRYKLEAEAYILYSVGWNGVDDAGTVPANKRDSSEHLDEGDWVWRFPAARQASGYSSRGE